MGRKPKSTKLKSVLALILAALMVLGVAGSLISVAFGADVSVTEITQEAAPYGEVFNKENVIRTKDEEVKNPDIVVEGKIGYDGKFTVGSVNPVEITVSNNGSGILAGTADLKVYTSERNSQFAGEFVSYSNEISVGAGETKTLLLDVYFPTSRAYFLVSIKDENGNTIKSRNLYSEPVFASNGILGVVGGKREENSHFYGLEYISDNYEYTTNQTALVDIEEVPFDEKKLNSFSAFIFKNGSFDELKDDEKADILKWVKRGGFLITDSDIEEDLSPFNSYFDYLKMGKGEIYVSKSNLLSNDDEIMAYKTIPVEKNNTNISVRGRETATPSLETDIIRNMFILIAVYVVAIGPVLYIVLKKLDKREKAIILIPGAAVICVLAIVALGGGSAYRNGIVNITNMFEIDDEGNYSGSTNLSFKTAEVGKVMLESENIPFTPFRIEAGYNSSYADAEDINVAEVFVSDNGTKAAFENEKSWDYIVLNDETEGKLEGGIEAEFYMEGNKIKGYVANNTGFDLEDISVITFNTGEKIDKLENGKTEQIEIVIDELNVLNSREAVYATVSSIYGMNGSRREVVKKYGADVDSEDAFRLINRINYTERQIDMKRNYPESDGLNVQIVAFARGIADGEFKANGKKTVVFEETMLYKDEKIDFSGRYEIPYGRLMANASAETNDYGYTYGVTYLYSIGEDIIYTYAMPDRETVSEFNFDRNETYADVDGYGREQIYIYNVLEDNWENLSYESYTEAEKYINDSNELKLKIYISEENEYFDPRINVKGGGK